MAHKLIGAIATKWYKILSHIGSDAIEQLPKHINSVELTEFTNKQVLLKIKYKTYLISTYIQQIS
jgi:hypothetical protein